MIFGGIAAVSLFVAAINIINTMTMAIYGAPGRSAS